MVVLGEDAQVDAWFGLLGDSANLYKIGAWFVWNVAYAWKSIWMHLMELLEDVCHMKSRFDLFRDSVSFGVR